jgi:DNA-binding transcriptional LysR family regulator
MDRLQNIEAFVRVANTQSFAEAARQLRVAKSVVTTRVKQLEDYLGAPLFHRSTRVVRLSELGEAFLRDCSELVVKASDIVDQMRDVHGTPAGSLRVQVIPGLVHGQFASLIQSFQAAYPDIRLDLTVSDIVVDPVKAVLIARSKFSRPPPSMWSPSLSFRFGGCFVHRQITSNNLARLRSRANFITTAWGCTRVIPLVIAGPSIRMINSSRLIFQRQCSPIAFTCSVSTL